MMPSLPIGDRPDTRYSCWLAAGSSLARIGPPDRPAVTPSIRSSNVRSTRPHRRVPPSIKVTRSHRPQRSSLSKSKLATKSP